MDFVRRWSEKTEISAGRFIEWLGIRASKFYDWRDRYGQVNEHNSWVPRDFWLEQWEKQAIVDFHLNNPLEGYRRLTFMMLDQDVVAVSPSSVWRVLGQAGLSSDGRASVQERDGVRAAVTGAWALAHRYFLHQYQRDVLLFVQRVGRLQPFLVHWDLRESMTEADIEIILERAKERYPEARPRIISDNGPQFLAKDFKEFIRISGMTHVRTSPYYPQSNGKLERWHKSLKSECIRPVNASQPGRCAPFDPALRGPLQPGPVAQRDRIRDPHGHARRPAGRDSRRARPEAGSGAQTAQLRQRRERQAA